MVFEAFISTVHVLGLGVGLGSIHARANAFAALARGDTNALARVLNADNWWGIAAILWIGSGFTRLLAEHEKALSFFLYNGFFWVKMTLFASAMALELWPMVTLIRWRVAQAKGGTPDTGRARTFATVSRVETALIVAIAVAAPLMARGVWLFALEE